jgi:hypothetical protein
MRWADLSFSRVFNAHKSDLMVSGLSINDKERCTSRGKGAMRLGIISNLIAHPWFENEHSAIFELGVQLAFKTQEDVSFHAPVISKVAGRIFNHPDTDAIEVLGSPVSSPRLSFVFNPVY